MENIKFSVNRRKGTAFPLEIKITGFQEKRKKKKYKYLFCDQLSRLVGSTIRRHFKDTL